MAHDFDESEYDLEEERRKNRVVMVPDRVILWLWRKLCSLLGI